VPDRLASLGTPDTFDPSELCAALDKIMQSEDSALFAAESDGRVVGRCGLPAPRRAKLGNCDPLLWLPTEPHGRSGFSPTGYRHQAYGYG